MRWEEVREKKRAHTTTYEEGRGSGSGRKRGIHRAQSVQRHVEEKKGGKVGENRSNVSKKGGGPTAKSRYFFLKGGGKVYPKIICQYRAFFKRGTRLRKKAFAKEEKEGRREIISRLRSRKGTYATRKKEREVCSYAIALWEKKKHATRKGTLQEDPPQPHSQQKKQDRKERRHRGKTR